MKLVYSNIVIYIILYVIIAHFVKRGQKIDFLECKIVSVNPGYRNQSFLTPNAFRLPSQSTGKILVITLNNNPDGSRPSIMTRVMSGAKSVSFRVRAT